MLKKFKVDQNHPIIWQNGYTDSEITDLIAYKFQAKQKVEKQVVVMEQKQTP